MMMFNGMARTALINLRINTLRSCLTVLGITFGTGAVIATLSSNEGASRYIKAELAKIGTNILLVEPKDAAQELRSSHVSLLRRYGDMIAEASLFRILEPAQLQRDSRVYSGTAVGIDASYFAAVKQDLRTGRAPTQGEIEGRGMVVVLGSAAADALFGKHPAVNEDVTLTLENGAAFVMQVIGVLRERGGGDGTAVNQALYFPSTTAARLWGTARGTSRIAANLVSDEASKEARVLMEKLLSPAFAQGVAVSDSRESVERTQSIWRKQNLVGLCLAGICLLTGGVGIMNVMVLSIAQRRKEIGLRKAVGATHKDIVMQFLLESIFVCFIGGVTGAAIGTLFGRQIARMLGEWEAVTSPGVVAMAIAFSLLTGLVFGLFPAIRAAKIDPYDALRS